MTFWKLMVRGFLIKFNWKVSHFRTQILLNVLCHHHPRLFYVLFRLQENLATVFHKILLSLVTASLLINRLSIFFNRIRALESFQHAYPYREIVSAS